MSRVVVGVDGSDDSRRALRYAADEARAHGYVLVAVLACPFPDVIGPPGAAYPVEPHEDVERRAADRLRDVLGAEADALADVEVEPVTRCGHPADVLLAAAEDAALLVVGSRGLGGFRGLLLGSVSQQCVTHAALPVVVVPHQRAATG